MKDVFTYTKHNQWLMIYNAAAQPSASQLKKTGTDPLYVPIETEDVEDAVGIHLDRVQPVHHDNRRISMCAVLARRRGRRSVAWTVASPSTPSHWWTHTTTFVGRGSVAFIVTMVTASWRTRQKSGKWENVKITPVIKQGEVNTEICRANYIGHSTTSLPLCGGPNLHNRLNLNVPSLKWLLTHIGCR